MKKPTGSLISYFSRMASQEGSINLAQGKPGFLPPGELLELLKAFSNHSPYHQYAPGHGNLKLLTLLARKYSEFFPLSTDNLVVVQGATEGIFLTAFYLNTLLERPYSVLSFNPVYESYPKLATFLNLPFEYLDFAPDLSVDFERLERIIINRRVKIVFIASPGNPLGKIWTADEIRNIILLSKKLDFYIIFDTVYQDIYFNEPPFNPLALQPLSSHYDRLFYVNSFSKMLSITGWRIGYVIAEKNRMKKIRTIHDYTGLSAPTLFQAVIHQYLVENRHGQDYLKTIREKCRQSYAYLRQVLLEANFTVPEIQGGYFLWAGLPRKFEDGFAFALDLFHRVRVGVVPGENFSPTSTSYIRLNIAAELNIIREGAQRIKKFLDETY